MSAFPYKKTLVTGAGRGVGAALSRQLLARGSDLIALNRSPAPLDALLAELNQPERVSAVLADVSQFEQLERSLAAVLAEHDDIDLIILNAGLDLPQRITSFDWRIARSQIDTNLTANYVFLAALVPYLLARGGGRIALVSSLGSYAGCPYEHVYNASKAGTRMMLDGVRAELLDSSVEVTGIYPGFITTQMLDENAFAVSQSNSPEEAATLILDGIAAGEDEIIFPQETAAMVAQLRGLGPRERAEVVRSLMADLPA
jgi:short-subunit dehydrogenase